MAANGMRVCTCMCMREQQCRALPAYNYACIQNPKGGCIKRLFPKVRSTLFYIQNPTFFSPERGGRSEAEQQ